VKLHSANRRNHVTIRRSVGKIKSIGTHI
jgi:hypothetical protein